MPKISRLSHSFNRDHYLHRSVLIPGESCLDLGISMRMSHLCSLAVWTEEAHQRKVIRIKLFQLNSHPPTHWPVTGFNHADQLQRHTQLQSKL